MIPVVLFLLCIVAASYAAPDHAAHHEQVNTVLGGFLPIRPALPGSPVKLLFALPPSNMEGLHAALQEISDPRSSNYGQYLSKNQVEAFVAPKAESVQIVQDWLANSNISAMAASPSGDLLRADIPVELANTLLSADYTQFLHTASDTQAIRTLSYTIPPTVQEHLSFIYPTSQFIPPPTKNHDSYQLIERPYQFKGAPKRRRRAQTPNECEQYITPECLHDLYSIPKFPATAQGNGIAVSGFLDEIASMQDLLSFSDTFRPDISNPTFSVVSVENGPINGGGTPEASLDIDYTVGLATDIPVEFISVGNSMYDGLLDLTNHFLAQENPPLVVTTSYGVDENVFTQFPEMAHMICNAFAQLGARGTSVMFSSGDGGVSGHKSESSTSCDAGRPFSPTFPSTCPYVTSVGGTHSLAPELAAPFSSGGFSNLFPQPSYQSTAVSAYLASPPALAALPSYAGRYNASGRGYPDVSAQAIHYVVVRDGQFYAVNGTSAASPTFASVVALLNNQRLAARMPPLGFLNPLLYADALAGNGFNDVSAGNNPGCGTDGFPAGPGWDPVTGLGTPAYNNLVQVVTPGLSSTLANSARRRVALPSLFNWRGLL